MATQPISADQGIMALPEADAMPAVAPQDAVALEQIRQNVPRKEVTNELLSAASQQDPQAVQEFLNELRGLKLPASVISQLNDMVDEILANPEGYQELRAKYVQEGFEELLPEQFDPMFFGALNMALDQIEAGTEGEEGMEDEEEGEEDEEGEEAPEMEAPEGLAKGGIASLAKKGRMGDTMLAHITPKEAKLLKKRGGSGTINPKTGLPEYFLKSVGKALKSIGRAVKKFASTTVGKLVIGTALFMVAGPAAASLLGVSAPIGVAAISGFVAGAGTTLAAGGNLKDALKAGAIGGLTAGALKGVSTGMAGFESVPAPVEGVPTLPTNPNLPGTESALPGPGTAPPVEAATPPAATTGPVTSPTPDAAMRTPVAGPSLTPQQIEQAAMRAPVAPPVAPAAMPTPAAPVPAMPAPATGIAELRPAMPAPAAQEGILAAPAAPQAAMAPQAPTLEPTGGGLRFKGMTPTPSPIGQGIGEIANSPSVRFPLADVKSLQPAPTVSESLSKIGEGKFLEGAKDLFMPEGQASALRRYGPTAVAGLGILGLTGGFSPREAEKTPMQKMMENRLKLEQEYVLNNPGMFSPKGLERFGMIYNDKGQIIGSTPWGYAEGGEVRGYADGGDTTATTTNIPSDASAVGRANLAAAANNAYFKLYPDVLQDYINTRSYEERTPEEHAALHYREYGAAEDRRAPASVTASGEASTLPIDFNLPAINLQGAPRLPTYEEILANVRSLGRSPTLREDQTAPSSYVTDLQRWQAANAQVLASPIYRAAPIAGSTYVPLDIERNARELIERQQREGSPFLPPAPYTYVPPDTSTYLPDDLPEPGAWTPPATVEPPATVTPPPATTYLTPDQIKQYIISTAYMHHGPGGGISKQDLMAGVPGAFRPEDFETAYKGATTDILGRSLETERGYTEQQRREAAQENWQLAPEDFTSAYTNLVSTGDYGNPLHSGKFTQPQYTEYGQWLASNLDNPQLIAQKIQEKGATKGDVLAALQAANPNISEQDVNDYIAQNKLNLFAQGGIASLARGGYPRRTGAISGPGTPTSDSIPAMLSDGEFVMTEKAVRGAGNGDRRAGAKRMYALMHRLEKNAQRV